jgi:hypothetical protein
MHGLRDALEQSQKDRVAIGHFNVGDWVLFAWRDASLAGGAVAGGAVAAECTGPETCWPSPALDGAGAASFCPVTVIDFWGAWPIRSRSGCRSFSPSMTTMTFGFSVASVSLRACGHSSGSLCAS